MFGKDDKNKIIHKIDAIFQANEMMRPIYEEIIKEHILIHTKTKGLMDFKSKGLDALSV